MAGNLFDDLPDTAAGELVDVLLDTAEVRIEHIVSTGQATPAGEWFDQSTDEWVALLRGGAALRFDGDDEVVVMRPGDHVTIPAHRRHRVEWTDPAAPTVWLAVHCPPAAGGRAADPIGVRRKA